MIRQILQHSKGISKLLSTKKVIINLVSYVETVLSGGRSIDMLLPQLLRKVVKEVMSMKSITLLIKTCMSKDIQIKCLRLHA